MDEYTEEIKAMMEEVSTRESRRQTYLHENFPAWAAVSDAVDAAFSNTAQRTLIKRLCRVVYWLAKNRED